MRNTKVKFIEITNIQQCSGYKLKLSFNDGKTNTVDFEPFLKKARHPEMKKYLDVKRFRQLTFEYGHVHWNDYDLSFSIDELHKGKII